MLSFAKEIETSMDISLESKASETFFDNSEIRIPLKHVEILNTLTSKNPDVSFSGILEKLLKSEK
jgi:hypothetical protein